ncbi:MAG: hypothetical protein MZV70_29205 [Desulfobacterales bacterium]|nr:hypothetical protein [Desulfobacterales bacterium]
MTVTMFPAYDLEASFGKAVRSVFRDSTLFQVDMPSFTVAAGATSITFPEVGVDWRTVTLTGNTSAPRIVVFAPEGLVARMEFTAPQTNAITVSAYKRFTTYFVGDPRDVSFELMKYYGNPLSGTQQARHIPLAVTMITHVEMTRRAAFGEAAEVFGTLCVYGDADAGGLEVLKAEVKKIYEQARVLRPGFGTAGIKNFILDPPTYAYYQEVGAVNEARFDFISSIQIA